MSQNEFHQLDRIPKEEDLEKIVSNFWFVRVNSDSLPEAIRLNGLSQKCNSFLVAASGSSGGICYSAVGLRLDNNNTVIDEHPFVFYNDKTDPSRSFGGIINHGNWHERTVPLNEH